jgi:hypothetical protein
MWCVGRLAFRWREVEAQLLLVCRQRCGFRRWPGVCPARTRRASGQPSHIWPERPGRLGPARCSHLLARGAVWRGLRGISLPTTSCYRVSWEVTGPPNLGRVVLTVLGRTAAAGSRSPVPYPSWLGRFGRAADGPTELGR